MKLESQTHLATYTQDVYCGNLSVCGILMLFVGDKSTLLIWFFSTIPLGKPLNLHKGLWILEESILTFFSVSKDPLSNIIDMTIENKSSRCSQCLWIFSCENTTEINCMLTSNLYKINPSQLGASRGIGSPPSSFLYVSVCVCVFCIDC